MIGQQKVLAFLVMNWQYNKDLQHMHYHVVDYREMGGGGTVMS